MLTKGLPKISVIVPSYNHADFLAARLDAIAKQTFQDIEIILLDDASNDNSAEILRDFQATEKKVSYLEINTHNSGSVNQQWLKGLQHARGDYVWIAESDDLTSPNFLAILYQQFINQTNLVLAYSDSVVINECGTRVENYDYRFKYFNDIWQQSFVIDGEVFVRDFLIFRNVIPNVSAVLFKKSYLQQALQANSFVYLGDWVCYVKLALKGKIAFVKDDLNLFRKHTNTTRWHNEKSYIRAMKEKLALLRMIKNQRIEGSAKNLSLALVHLFSNRHKYKRVFRLLETLKKSNLAGNNIALYGFNDICDILVTELSHRYAIPCIFDRGKSGIFCHGIPVIGLNPDSLQTIDVVVICSLEHAQSIKTDLAILNYCGLTFVI